MNWSKPMSEITLNVANVGVDGGMLVRLDDVKGIFQSQAKRIAELEKDIAFLQSCINSGETATKADRPSEKNKLKVGERIAELENELERRDNSTIQLMAAKLALLHEPDVLTGWYRMDISKNGWSVWTPIHRTGDEGE